MNWTVKCSACGGKGVTKARENFRQKSCKESRLLAVSCYLVILIEHILNNNNNNNNNNNSNNSNNSNNNNSDNNNNNNSNNKNNNTGFRLPYNQNI